ncbi:electron transfer flavoprotein subunit alpha/FixB family protein [Candidatus Kapabacteria bacterium]|nr:electron transfer flavoprotein subunit alpha/FixB family protein [Candidatus Kapabacteria bacterium]
MSKILVFVEENDGNLKRSSNEALSAASKFGSEVIAIAVNANDSVADAAANYGANKTLNASHDLLENYSSVAVAKVIAQAAKSENANSIFLSANSAGKELAPRVAVHLEAGYIADCVDFEDEGGLVASKPVYAGKALIKTKVNTNVGVYSLRPNVFTSTENKQSANLESFSPDLSDSDFSVVVKEVKKSEGKIDVAEASAIVSGGRGLKEAANFNLVEDLASSLNAAVGASRAVVDAGWRPHSEQVGQTGKTVSPNLYVAVGISGAVQHLAGMSSSKVIFAINKDKDAPIFKVADYGIVGDAFDIVPKVIDKIKALG